jgi:hypothetical protein
LLTSADVLHVGTVISELIGHFSQGKMAARSLARLAPQQSAQPAPRLLPMFPNFLMNDGLGLSALHQKQSFAHRMYGEE